MVRPLSEDQNLLGFLHSIGFSELSCFALFQVRVIKLSSKLCLGVLVVLAVRVILLALNGLVMLAWEVVQLQISGCWTLIVPRFGFSLL